jgi:hypothetical protein
MKDKSFTPDQCARYFESRIDARFTGRSQLVVRCCFHDDRTASLSINTEKGVWTCFTGCGSGGILDFEEKYSHCDRATAIANVQEILNDHNLFTSSVSKKPDAIYDYVDATNKVIAQKLRYRNPDGKKYFKWRVARSGGGYEWHLPEGFKKPLYRLHELIRSNYCIVTEGEKDADNVRARLEEHPHFAVTTGPDGASKPGQRVKWDPEYAPYFTGKFVTILPDNDDAGRNYANFIAESISPYAAGIKMVALPTLAEHEDVSNYLISHTGEDLLREIEQAPWWEKQRDARFLVPAVEFMNQAAEEIDWLVDHVIERRANGFICAEPKGGKSWVAVDLAMSIASGSPWLQGDSMGFAVPRPAKVALISREDTPGLTAWRMKHLFAGKTAEDEVRQCIGLNLYVNTRQQTPELMLDNAEQMAELLVALKDFGPEFVIFDVFNVLHAADENSNQEMRPVLRLLSKIHAEVGAGIGVVHHYNKGDNSASMTQRLRGSSAIAGWAEWLIGISMEDAETKTRKIEFELKAAAPPPPIYYVIEGDQQKSKLRQVLMQTVQRPANALRKVS